MRKIFILIFSLAAGSFFSQDRFCHTSEELQKWFSQHPELKRQFDLRRAEKIEAARIAHENGYQNVSPEQQKSAAASTYTIPVVFHILHQGGSENISDAQVIDQVNILTRDFNKLNADTANVVAAFKNKIGNPSVAFVLATRDPNGICTNGILRHWDAKTNWTGSFSNYKYSWPSNQYLNIYVVNTINSNAAGYTFLPGSGVPASVDAIVVLHSYVGSMGTSSAFKSRVLTHEVGHWLDLEHTWGLTNNPGVSCGDDGVFDTPETKGFTQCSLSSPIVCNAGVVENVQNYMEYSYCDIMFTPGQATRIQNALNSSVSGRNNLSKTANLLATGVLNPMANCVPKINILATPGQITCTGKPVTFTSFTSNAAPSSYSWSTANGVSIQDPTAATTTITFAGTGTYVVGCTVSNINGSNSTYSVIVVKDGDAEVSSGSSESFEDMDLPQYWQVINETTPDTKWEPTMDAASHGGQSMYIAGENLAANSIEILEGPAYDFKNNLGAQYTFKYAYARASSSNKDVFKVQASSDCGGTWQDIYFPGNGQMAIGSGEVTSTVFVPDEYSWKEYNLTNHPNFKPFKNEAHVNIRYYFQEDPGGTGFGNRMYLDQINFETPTGVNELTRRLGLSLVPNPANEQCTLSFTLADAAEASVEVTTISGQRISRSDTGLLQPGPQQHRVETGGLAAGMYLVNLDIDGVRMSRKLIVE